MLLLLTSKKEPFLYFNDISNELTNIGIENTMLFIEDINHEHDLSSYSHFYLRSNIQSSIIVYHYLLINNIIPINSGAYENSFIRTNIKNLLYKLKILTPKYHIAGSDNFSFTNKSKYLYKDYSGLPYKPVDTLNNICKSLTNDIIYFESVIDGKVSESKIYVMLDIVYLNSKGAKNASICNNSKIISISKRLRKNLRLDFFSFDIIEKENLIYVIDVNQTPTFFHLSERNKLFANSVKKLLRNENKNC